MGNRFLRSGWFGGVVVFVVVSRVFFSADTSQRPISQYYSPTPHTSYIPLGFEF